MERFGSTSRGGFSVRGIINLVLVVVLTALLWVIVGSQPAHAAGETDANWSGETIIADGHAFTKTTDLKDTTGTIPAGATVYKTTLQPATNNGSQKVFIIYFSSGVDPPTATSAEYVEFTFKDNQLSNPQNARTLTLTVQGEQDEFTSCSVGGIGWIICPLSVFFAEAMDNLFQKVLAPMISVQPSVLGDPNNSMYVAWNIMRNIANIAFVIVFLIIIYSQLTNYGVTNYGLKKLVPRLIIAAVLVNVSFIISAIAIDISNILGYSIQDVFNTIREETFQLTNDNFGGVNENPWTAVTGVILAGGGVIGGMYFAGAGGLYLLIPLLLGLFLTLIFVVIVLAARQAIIVILVIVAPLAFVANLLPNTEKWFDKWKDLFFTMLIFFPAFSLVFGGSQLAGQIIIANAGDNIVMVLFGLAVQIAPLVITPLILKFSGNLLGRIAQIANNPSKGVLDRNRNWAQRRAEHAKQQNLAKGPRLRNPASWGSGMNRYMEGRKRNLEERTNVQKQNADNRYHGSKAYEKIHEAAYKANTDKEILENKQKQHIQGKVNTVGSSFHLQNVQLEAGKRVLEQSVKFTEADVKEYDAGRVPVGSSPELQGAIKRMQAARQAGTIEGMRAQNADQQIQRELAGVLSTNEALRVRAGGIKPEPFGANSVLASAVSAVRQADAQDIKNIQDASDLGPGDLKGAAERMVEAIQANDSIRARAYQNMLVTAGGAGMEKFRTTMLDLETRGITVPKDVDDNMRDNMLTNHGALKGKSNDLIEWAAKGETLGKWTKNAASWAGLSDMDFITQHPKSQAYAFENPEVPGSSNAFTKERAANILSADEVAGNLLTEDVKAKLRAIADS